MALSDNIQDIKKDVDTVKSTVVDPVLKIQQATAKTSLMRLTKDQVFQFPIIMDADIDDDEKYPIIKSLEKNYAQIVLIAITNEGFVDRDKYSNINEFLRRFHNNNNLPFNAVKAMANESLSELELREANAYEGYLSNKELEELWDCVEEQLDNESINDMYLPYQRTAAKLTRAIEAANLSLAMENMDSEKYFRMTVYKKDKKGNVIKDSNGNPIAETDRNGYIQYMYSKAPTNKEAYDNAVKAYGPAKTVNEWNDINFDKKIAEAQQEKEMELKASAERERKTIRNKIRGEVVKDDKFSNLSPTILKMTLANAKSATSWSQDLIIGIKAMPRFLPQSLMIANMVEAFKDRAIFKFIKWTKGELKLIDLLFGWSEAKNNAIANADSKWLKVLRKRAKKNNSFRASGNKLNPNCTIIITESDAHMIYEKCGIDPHNVEYVKKVMNKYFLLGFGIYDTEAKMLNIIYDGENEFSHQSLRSMMAESKKEANLLSMNKY